MDLQALQIVLAQVEVTEPTGFSELAPPIQIALFLGALSLATAAMVCLTAFTRIIIVLSFIRRALSTQEIPPNQVMVGLAVFLTLFVMAPTLENIYQNGVEPYLSVSEENEELKRQRLNEMIEVGSHEIKTFMQFHTRDDELAMFFELANSPPPQLNEDENYRGKYDPATLPFKVLVPAFVISELKTAFIMGFCIYIPFLLIDLVISTVLMSLGMMMMPPVVISTPCKLLLFVLVDGWQLISHALVFSFEGLHG